MNGGTPHNLDAGGAHLFDRARDVPVLQLDTAGAVLDEESPETQPPRIQRGELHAVVGGETEHVDLGRSAYLEVVAQARRLPQLTRSDRGLRDRSRHRLQREGLRSEEHTSELQSHSDIV